MLNSYRPVPARRFVSSGSQYLRSTTVPVSAVPLTLAAWAIADNVTANHIPLMLSDEAASLDGFYLEMSGVNAGDPLRAVSVQGSTFRIASTSTGFKANTWCHCCGVFATSTSRTAYINGGSSGTAGSSSTPAGVTYINIGRFGNNAPSYGDLAVAWPAIWNIALSEPDIALLASGVPPWMVKPESLVACWDFTGRDLEPSIGIYGNSYPLTNSGSTVIEGPAFLKTRQRSRLWLGATQPTGGGGNRRRRMLIAGTR